MALHRPADLSGCIAGADGDRDVGGNQSRGLHLVPDADQWRPQVAIDVVRERLHRGYIEDAAALAFRRCRLGGQAIEAPEECGQRLAAACRRRHEDVAAGRDLLPATLLDLRGVRESAPKPLSRGGRKQVERVSHLISLSRSQRTNECSSTLPCIVRS